MSIGNVSRPADGHCFDLDEQVFEGKAGDSNGGRAGAGFGIELALHGVDRCGRFGDLWPVAGRL